MSSSQKHRRYENFGIQLDTGSEIIEPKSFERILGAQISNDFTWNYHIRDSDSSLLKSLTSKIKALGKISKHASFKTRKSVGTA